MGKQDTISIEEAVARMVNVDCDSHFPLLEMTDAFREEAEVEYENAIMDEVSMDMLERLRLRMEIARARHDLAKNLLEELRHEIKKPEDSEIEIVPVSDGEPRLEFVSVSFWATMNYGIDISKKAARTKKKDKARWEDVKIKIYEDHQIDCRVGDKKLDTVSFSDVGLMGVRKDRPNKYGNILASFAVGGLYPHTTPPRGNERVAMTNIRKSLQKLTGFNDDPFSYDAVHGWKPRFQIRLIDHMKYSADISARKVTVESFDDTKRYP